MRIVLGIIFVSCFFFSASAQERSVKVFDKYDALEEAVFSHNNDTTYVVNFWATWCKPCVAELPYFEELNRKYANEKLKVILVSLDFKRQIEKRLIPFIEKKNIQSEVVLLNDPKANDWIDRVDPSWSGAIPITVVYKKEKRIFFEKEFSDFEDLEKEVKKVFD